MKTIKIEIPEGFEVDNFDQEKGVLNLRPCQLNIRERLRTMGDVFAFHKTTADEFNKSCKGLAEDEIGYRKEKMIVAAYNNNQLPDWSDGKPKFYPWFNMPSSGSAFSFGDCGDWRSVSFVGSRLVFVGPDAKENLLDAVKKFLPEYQQSRTS